MIRPDLEAARKRTAPRTQDLYQLFNTLLYLLKTGCQWRQLPHDFPKWTIVYYYYRIWSAKGAGFQASLLEQVLVSIYQQSTTNRYFTILFLFWLFKWIDVLAFTDTITQPIL